jgi:hypothetical protein
MFLNMLEYSYVSLGGTVVLLIFSYLFVPVRISRKRRAILGLVHVSAHLTAAMILMLLLEIGIEICIRHGLLGTAGELRFSFMKCLSTLVQMLPVCIYKYCN